MNTLKLIDRHLQTLQNNKEITDQWIAALRSNKWVQTTGAMTDKKIPNSACCLMVLEAKCNNKTVNDYLYDVGHKKHSFSLPSRQPNPLVFIIENSVNILPETLTAEDIVGNRYSPAEWNDVLNLNFDQIADLLENGEIQFEP